MTKPPLKYGDFVVIAKVQRWLWCTPRCLINFIHHSLTRIFCSTYKSKYFASTVSLARKRWFEMSVLNKCYIFCNPDTENSQMYTNYRWRPLCWSVWLISLFKKPSSSQWTHPSWKKKQWRHTFKVRSTTLTKSLSFICKNKKFSQSFYLNLSKAADTWAFYSPPRLKKGQER